MRATRGFLGRHAVRDASRKGSVVPLLAAACAIAQAQPTPLELDRLAAQSAHRWELSEHGEMLSRIVPRQLAPSELPDPESEGARLTGLYCVQCHYLPSPAMHDADRWEKVVLRMVPRMRGEGNMGRLMTEMMLGPLAWRGGDKGGAGASGRSESAGGPPQPRPLSAPSPAEVEQIVSYLRAHAMRALSDNLSPALERDLSSEQGRMFAAACGQCHALPAPAAHTAAEWPAIVQRMEKHMRVTNRVVDADPDPREPRLEPAKIIQFLQRQASPISASSRADPSRP